MKQKLLLIVSRISDFFIFFIQLISELFIHLRHGVYFLKVSLDMFFLEVYFFLTRLPFYIVYLYSDYSTVQDCYWFCFKKCLGYYRWYFRRFPYKYGWRRVRRRPHDSILHEMAFTREFAFIFFYILIIAVIVYSLIFLFRPSQKIRLFETNRNLNKFMEDEFFFAEGKLKYKLPPLDWLTKFNIFFIQTRGGFILAAYYYFYVMWIHRFLYRLFKGKRGFNGGI
jgi:hypothetical protein